MDDARLNEIREYLNHTATGPHWERIGVRQRNGVCVPLFSLRSERDCGIGDVADLEALIDWCHATGLEVVQILPINDMGLDSVPYSALSAFALDPVFLALDRIDVVRRDPALMARVRAEGTRLNGAERIDYQEVRRAKSSILEAAFAQADGPELQAELARFEDENGWLADYLPFRVLKECHEYRSWEDWGRYFPTREAVDGFMAEHQDRRRFHLYLQWLLAEQFGAAREYAARRGVLLKGDIPILVARDSADVWRHPEYFHMGTAAGAPPDMYAEDGQYWGFPTYNWDSLRYQDYGWWRERLRYAQRFFDLYRIDHVVGFFRIWTIALGAENGREGWYVPGNEAEWGDHGRRLLTMMLESSHMLPLAEDLGTIPHICRSTLKELGICGLKVQRWEKRWEEDSSIIAPTDYHPLSVSTLSTHDSETLSGWWADFRDDRNQLWHFLGGEGEAPATLDSDLHRRILGWSAQSGSLFNLFMLQELLEPFGRLTGDPREHRINVPGTVNGSNWSWRSPVTLDALLTDDDLRHAIRQTLRG
jgi:4-alpha-glucanotransferase